MSRSPPSLRGWCTLRWRRPSWRTYLAACQTLERIPGAWQPVRFTAHTSTRTQITLQVSHTHTHTHTRAHIHQNADNTAGQPHTRAHIHQNPDNTAGQPHTHAHAHAHIHIHTLILVDANQGNNLSMGWIGAIQKITPKQLKHYFYLGCA